MVSYCHFEVWKWSAAHIKWENCAGLFGDSYVLCLAKEAGDSEEASSALSAGSFSMQAMNMSPLVWIFTFSDGHEMRRYSTEILESIPSGHRKDEYQIHTAIFWG